MIPDHLLRRAAQAALVQGVYGDPDSGDLLDDMHPADLEATLDTTRAALEAVAADIWDDGYVAGVESAHEFFAGENNADTPNPYKASEDA